MAIRWYDAVLPDGEQYRSVVHLPLSFRSSSIVTVVNAPKRILIAECLHEVCSFNPAPTTYNDFFVNFGEQMLAYHQRGGTEMAGACQVFGERRDLEVIPTFSARGIASGGTIPAADFRRIANEFLSSLRNSGAVDAYLTLHGAMAAETGG